MTYHQGVDALTPQSMLLWGDREIRALSTDDELAAVERRIVSLMKSDPPDYQPGRPRSRAGGSPQAPRVARPDETAIL